MTILNVWVGRDRALVGVDTLGVVPDGPAGRGVPARCELTKLFPLVAADCLVAGRGDAGFIWSVYLGCLGTVPATFDTLAAAMPNILQAAVHVYEAMQPAQTRRPAGGLQLALVGWSPRQERMCGVVFSRAAAGQPFERLVLGGDGGEESDDWIAPWEDEQGEAPVPDTPGAMLDLVLRQVGHAPAGAPVGGRLIVAELRRDSLTVQTVCELAPGGSAGT